MKIYTVTTTKLIIIIIIIIIGLYTVNGIVHRADVKNSFGTKALRHEREGFSFSHTGKKKRHREQVLPYIIFQRPKTQNSSTKYVRVYITLQVGIIIYYT